MVGIGGYGGGPPFFLTYLTFPSADTCHNVVLLSLIIFWSEYGNICFFLQAMLLVIPLLTIVKETLWTCSAEVRSEPAATSGDVAGPVGRLLIACATNGDVRLVCQVSESGFNVHQ